MMRTASELLAYFKAEKPLVCEFEVGPYRCEFWPRQELAKYNKAYEVAEYAHGYFGFGSNGGGEMLALSPDGAVVSLPFVGVSPGDALPVAASWAAFKVLLENSI